LEQTSGKQVGREFGICMNPEFMRETTAIDDFHHPPFTIIGARDDLSAERVAAVYSNLKCPIERTPILVAEMIKYACNAFHAVKVCFANEIGNLIRGLVFVATRELRSFTKTCKLTFIRIILKPELVWVGV